MKYLKAILAILLLVTCAEKIPNEYLLDEKDLFPKGIAYSEKKGAFYLTSVTKSKNQSSGYWQFQFGTSKSGDDVIFGVRYDSKLLVYEIGKKSKTLI